MFGKRLKIRLLFFDFLFLKLKTNNLELIKNLKFKIKLSRRFLFASFIFAIFLFCRWWLTPRLSLNDGQLIKVSGRLTEEPQAVENRQNFRLGLFLITTERYPEFHYGDYLLITGRVKKQGYFYRLNYPQIVLKQTGTVSLTVKLRNKLREVYRWCLPSPLDGVIAGVVLGDKSLLPADFWLRLRQTGTLHLMVASGANIAFLSGGLLGFLCFFFRRRLALIILIILIWFYSILTGLQPPIVRAAIMASLTYLAQLFGREAQAGRVLGLTGAVMIIINPNLLADVGFQLSFLATAGLIYLQPFLDKFFRHFPGKENLTATLAAQAATLPILLTNFGQLNLASPVINFLVLWTIPYLLPLGMILGLMGVFWLKLAWLISFLLLPILLYTVKIIDLTASLTFFQLHFKPSWWWGIFYYLILVILLNLKFSES